MDKCKWWVRQSGEESLTKKKEKEGPKTNSISIGQMNGRTDGRKYGLKGGRSPHTKKKHTGKKVDGWIGEIKHKGSVIARLIDAS